jgi:hypothetical protein
MRHIIQSVSSRFSELFFKNRHCEEQSDAAIQFLKDVLDCHAALAMTVLSSIEPAKWLEFRVNP